MSKHKQSIRELNRIRTNAVFKAKTGIDISMAGINLPKKSRLIGDERKVAAWNKYSVARPCGMTIAKCNIQGGGK